jgi:hypothetical protein
LKGFWYVRRPARTYQNPFKMERSLHHADTVGLELRMITTTT